MAQTTLYIGVFTHQQVFQMHIHLPGLFNQKIIKNERVSIITQRWKTNERKNRSGKQS
jgi:hypothetical protein